MLSSTPAEPPGRSSSGQDSGLQSRERGFESSSPRQLEPPTKLYRALGYATFAAKAGDFASTEAVLANGGYEQNPLMQSRGLRVAGTIALPVLVNWGSEEIREQGHPRLALWVRIAFVAIHGAVTAHNLREAR